jgi:hypothetical protein
MTILEKLEQLVKERAPIYPATAATAVRRMRRDRAAIVRLTHINRIYEGMLDERDAQISRHASDRAWVLHQIELWNERRYVEAYIERTGFEEGA